MAKFYIRSLDGLRGVAVLLVFLFHFGRLPFIKYKFEVGWLGVQLFFVLSGYLITRILLEQKEAKLATYLKDFYWRRSLRIFPLYFGYLIILTVLFITINLPDNFETIAGYLFSYTYNFSILSIGPQVNRVYTHLWSLCVEEQFYLIWPIVIYFLSTKQLKILSIALIIIIPVFRFELYNVLHQTTIDPETLGTSVYWFSLSHFDAFAIGGAVNFLDEKLVGFKPSTWLLGILSLAATVGVLNYLIISTEYPISVTSVGFEIHSVRNYEFVWAYTLLNILFAASIWYLVRHESSLLSAKPLVFLGKISYGIYLLHFPIMGILSKVLAKTIVPDIFVLFVCALATLTFAWLSHEFYEKRFLRLKDAF
jgi:peptidoglycan/LPS O-acetylase OafA/YrhL